MKLVIECCKDAGMDDVWAMEVEAQASGLPMRRTRWLFVASVGGVGNWFLRDQVMFQC
jgi:hypothetical protein